MPLVAARDGHEFIPHAVDGGAAAILVRKDRGIPSPPGVSVVAVDDTLDALTRLARDARVTKGGPAVAITGSNGKTTTRAMVKAVLEAGFGEVLATQGNLNNHLGVPLTLLDRPHEPHAMVVELGMSAPGENDHLASIVQPDVGVVTSVAIEHLEFMGSIEAIAAAEAEVVAHVPAAGAVVVPSDEPLLRPHLPQAVRPAVWTVGPDDGATVRIVDVAVAADDEARTRATFGLPGGDRVTVWLSTFGAHNARNAGAALAVGLHLGVAVPAMVDALEAVRPVGDRGRVHRLGGHLLVADCYNANPGSMEAALGSLAQVRRPGPRIAVLGDMLELGPTEETLHREVGELVAKLGLTAVLGVGPRSEALVAAARGAGVAADHLDTDAVALATAWVRERLDGAEPGTVLFKGSRGIALERVVEALLA